MGILDECWDFLLNESRRKMLWEVTEKNEPKYYFVFDRYGADKVMRKHCATKEFIEDIQMVIKKYSKEISREEFDGHKRLFVGILDYYGILVNEYQMLIKD